MFKRLHNIILNNPPYGANKSQENSYFAENFLTADNKYASKGSLNTFSLFIEKGFNLLKKDGYLKFIVPISVISSDSMAGVHKLLLENCETVSVSSYAVRPQPIFKNAMVDVSIIAFKKTLSSNKRILTTKLHRKRKNEKLKDIIDNLKFIDSKNLFLPGCWPKVGQKIEKSILEKLFELSHLKTIKELLDSNGVPIYYRSAGGRYYKVITPYSTEASTETSLIIKTKFQHLIGAILSSSLFFWFYQIYSDNLSLRQHHIGLFPFPKLRNNEIKIINDLHSTYSKYLKDIEKNSKIRKGVGYKHISQFKEYRIRESKHIIDQMDDIICPLYGLNQEETDFIKNYEIDLRVGSPNNSKH